MLLLYISISFQLTIIKDVLYINTTFQSLASPKRQNLYTADYKIYYFSRGLPALHDLTFLQMCSYRRKFLKIGQFWTPGMQESWKLYLILKNWNGIDQEVAIFLLQTNSRSPGWLKMTNFIYFGCCGKNNLQIAKTEMHVCSTLDFHGNITGHWCEMRKYLISYFGSFMWIINFNGWKWENCII